MFEPILLGAAYIDRLIMSVHLAERKVVFHHFSLIPILMQREAKTEAGKGKKNFNQDLEEHMALLMSTTKCEPGDIKVARQAIVKELCARSVLVLT